MRASYARYIKDAENSIDNGPAFGLPPAADNSFPMPRCNIAPLNRMGTLFLAMLMHFQRKRYPNAEADNDGWFLCSSSELIEEYEDELADPSFQWRTMRIIEANGFIKREVKGRPPLRYIWIDYDRIDTIMNAEKKRRKALAVS